MRIGRVACRVLPSMLVGSLAAGSFGCSAPASHTDLRPEGPPDVLQVFVTERSEGATGLGLYYNANEEYAVDVTDGQGGAANGCGDVFDEQGDDCTVATAAANADQKVRIIFDELLKGSSVEEFMCACNSGDKANCPNMVLSSTDPADCANNPDTTADEQGRWLDDNNDGMPDKARLVDKLVTFNCDGTDIYTTGPGDGFYNPSGNQLIPVATQLAGLGPALVIINNGGLKTSADCSIKFGSAIIDKQGETVPALPATATFHTETLAPLKSVPAAGGEIAGFADNITVTFNAFLASADGIGIRVAGTTTLLPATVMLGMTADTVVINPTADLLPNTMYEVVIPATLADKYGGVIDAASTIAFKTKAQ
jgi:Bacterial Ig-like domain